MRRPLGEERASDSRPNAQVGEREVLLAADAVRSVQVPTLLIVGANDEAAIGMDREALAQLLCDATTEAECLRRRLVGTTQKNAVQALNIGLGDSLFLYNFRSGVLYGPLIASSAPDCHEPEAWGGRFPIQVRFDCATGVRSACVTEFASSATLKKLRRGGPLSVSDEEELSGILCRIS